MSEQLDVLKLVAALVAEFGVMKDTAPDVEATYAAMFASRSAADRLRMTCDMFDAAKTLMFSGIRASDPAISSEDLRLRMFERLYVDDFDQPTYNRIIRA